MHASIFVPVIASLLLIWVAQVFFSPTLLGVVLLCMLGFLCLGFKASQARSQRINQIVKACLVLAALGVIYFSYGTFIGVEAGTAALTVFLYGKALELKSKRDFIILFNFALFVSASLFLYSQSIWMAVMVLMCLISCLFGLYRIQLIAFGTNSVSNNIKQDIRHVLKSVLLAIPFFIILFIFFPRLPPLWHVPIASEQGITGISDRMSPGSITELSQSSELAFRIMMNLDQLPAQSDLYWRGMVLDQYDGLTWTSHPSNQSTFQIEKSNLEHYGIRYQYLAADPRQKWITGLEKSVPLERRLNLHQDFSMTAQRMVQRNQPIELLWIGQQQNRQIDQFKPWAQQLYTQFPVQRDLKAQQFAHELFQQSQQDPQQYIQRLIQWYQQHKFKYSLQPGRLGEHRVDEFLFQSREGFCEHYASSFALLMRYVGIPARVVVGYQGGQAAPDGQSWEVRQLDAHAWTEVYFDGIWHRFDPTAEIAPQRLNLGMQQFLSQDQSLLGEGRFSQLKYQQFAALKQLRIWSDYASYQWQVKVIGFNRDDQKKWLSSLGLSSTTAMILSMILILILLIVVYWLVEQYKTRIQKDRLQRTIERYSTRLEPQDQIQNYETFGRWIKRLQAEYVLDDITQLINLHHRIVYLKQESTENYQKFEEMIKAYTNDLKVKKRTCQPKQK